MCDSLGERCESLRVGEKVENPFPNGEAETGQHVVIAVDVLRVMQRLGFPSGAELDDGAGCGVDEPRQLGAVFQEQVNLVDEFGVAVGRRFYFGDEIRHDARETDGSPAT